MLPEEVNFGWAVFEVELVDGPLVSEGSEAYGDVDMNEYKIRIDSRMKPEIQLETFFHEIFHVLLEMSGAGHETNLNPDNETLTTYLSRHFLSVLNLNPWLQYAISSEDSDYSPFMING
jgi:hypothetical protein